MPKVYHIVNSPRVRRCYACLEVKPLKDFKKASYCKTGYKGICKKCSNLKNRKEPTIAQPFLFPMKVCTQCGKEKLLNEFNDMFWLSDGHDSQCNECRTKKYIDAGGRIYTPSMYHGIILWIGSTTIVFPVSKSCTECEQEKLLSDFGINSKGVPRSDCKQCQSAESMRWFRNHPEQVRQHNQRRQADPNYIVYHRNKEREYYNTNPRVATHRKKRAREWAQANPLRVNEVNRRREARKKETSTGRVSYTHILERDGAWCYLCEQSIDLTLPKRHPSSLVFEHKIPLSPRPGEPKGTHTENNIHPAHWVCNNRKSNKRFEDLTPFDRRGPDN